MWHEHADVYHSCISLGYDFQNILWAVPFPKTLSFIFVLSSQSCGVPCPVEYAQTSWKCLLSLQNYSFFWNSIYRKSLGIFWLAKTVFFKDLHWIKTIKPFDFPEAKIGTGWKIVDWCIACTRCQKNRKSAIDYYG